MIQDRKCKQCGASFQGGPRAYYCPSCRAERAKQDRAEYRRRKRQGEVRELGSTDTCKLCGSDYTVKSGLQRFCPECQPIHNAEYDRETALPYYHANKEKINPVRKIKRRKRGNICLWCGNEFVPVNGSVTCSDQCRRQYANQYAREWRKQKRAKDAKSEISPPTI